MKNFGIFKNRYNKHGPVSRTQSNCIVIFQLLAFSKNRLTCLLSHHHITDFMISYFMYMYMYVDLVQVSHRCFEVLMQVVYYLHQLNGCRLLSRDEAIIITKVTHCEIEVEMQKVKLALALLLLRSSSNSIIMHITYNKALLTINNTTTKIYHYHHDILRNFVGEAS